MSDRLIFGKPLPRAVHGISRAAVVAWMPVLLVAGVGLVGWVMMKLLRRGKNEVEHRVFH